MPGCCAAEAAAPAKPTGASDPGSNRSRRYVVLTGRNPGPSEGGPVPGLVSREKLVAELGPGVTTGSGTARTRRDERPDQRRGGRPRARPVETREQPDARVDPEPCPGSWTSRSCRGPEAPAPRVRPRARSRRPVRAGVARPLLGVGRSREEDVEGIVNSALAFCEEVDRQGDVLGRPGDLPLPRLTSRSLGAAQCG